MRGGWKWVAARLALLALLGSAKGARADEPEHKKGYFRADVGFETRLIYGIPIFGVGALVSAGFEKISSFEFGGCLAFFLGQTRFGLAGVAVQLGPCFLVRIAPRVRLGGGIRVGTFAILDPGNGSNGRDGLSLTAGAFLGLTVDLVPFGKGRHAFYATARVSADLVGTGEANTTAGVYGFLGGVGLRL